MPPVKSIPDGYNTVTIYLVIKGAAEALEFYKKAFGAVELERHLMPGADTIMHAKMKIGDTIMMLSEDFGNCGCHSPKHLNGVSAMMHLYVEDADALYAHSISAGAEATTPMFDAFWGDRYGMVKDPFGHLWSIGTHKEDLTPEQVEARAKEAFASMKC